ncbi:MAG: hypothetical protein A2X34_00635, partial [Elusimicrobia bacterium GWC2_51_8]
SAFTATTAVTLAAPVSSGTFHFNDVGHNTLNLSFSAFENPGPVSGSAWASASLAMPASRSGQDCVVYGTHVFVSGGFDGVYYSSAVYRAEINAAGLSAWQAAGYMPEPLSGHQLVAARGRLYIVGGYNQGGTHAAVWSSDISSTGILGAWEAETSLPATLYSHAAALAGNKLYVSGGYTSGSGVSAAVYKTTVGDDGALTSWSAIDPLPAPRYNHTMTFLANRLYAVGGKDGPSAKSSVWVMKLKALDAEPDGTWTALTSLPAARYGHKTLAAANTLYVIGGNNGGAVVNSVFISTVSSNAASPAAWLAYQSLSSARQFSAAAAFGDVLYVLGGSDGISAKNDIFISTLSGTRYMVEISSDDAFAVGNKSSGWMSAYNWSFGELEPAVTYYLRSKAVSHSGVETAYSAYAATITYAAVPGTAAWTGIGVTSATAHWLANGNLGADYQIYYSSYANYTPLAGTQNTAGLSADLSPLQPNTTYYAKVRVFNAAGRVSRFIELPPFKTVFDPALDTSSPTITDNQADDTLWRSTNAFAYNVDFNDTGGSGLDKFQVQAATDAGGVSGIVAPWSDAVSAIDADSYSQNWTIPNAVWNNMTEGASNYISVRAFDNVGLSSASFDVFSVMKDTTPPFIAVISSPSWAWYSQYPGDVSLRFDDALSGLYRLQYSVSVNEGFADAGVIGWTDIAGLTLGATYYESVINDYNFSLFANGVANYFSLRALDVAGSTRTLVDVFAVGKNVTGPMVVISTPSHTFISTCIFVAGTTSETNGHAVMGTEVSMRDKSTGLYWNGSAFLSASRIWYDASDAANIFTVAFENLALISGRQYEAVARSSDAVGEYSQVFATYTFTYDSQPPSAQVLAPADSADAYSIASISGTAADSASGVSSDEVVLKRLSDGRWWKNSASSWDTAAEPLQAGTTPYWTWNFTDILRDSLANGASYYVSVRASDKSFPANTGVFGVYGATFTYYDDNPPPPASTLSASAAELPGAAVLSWVSAGDNGATGYLFNGTYKIAYSTFSGAALSTSNAQVTLTTTAVTAGTIRAYSVTGLTPSVTHYFTLWTADDALNWSGASNEAVSLTGSSNSGGISGLIKDGAGQLVTGVLLEAFAPSGALEGSDYTNTSGIYSITGLTSDEFTVKATWAAEDIESSVSKDGVGSGAEGVNFSLSVTYQLASISGFIPANFLPAARLKTAAAYTTREIRPAENTAFVEIYRKGRRIGAAFVDPRGAFKVPNLLPGTYSIRVYNGSDYSKMETVSLKAGQNFVFSAKWALLDKDKVYAYPNPAGKIVNFHFSSSFEKDTFAAEVEVFDISGRLVKKLNNVVSDSVAGGSKITWDMSAEKVASGVYIYILRLKDPATGDTEKAIKKFAIIR